MTTSSQPVLYEREGAIARIRLNRPKVLNALDSSMAQTLLATCKAIQSADGIRVVVLTGEGRAFMAGGDLARFHDNLAQARKTAVQLIGPLHEALAILAALPQPVLASVHGPVAGAGVSLALACDLAIASDDTSFNLAYARIGASADGSVSWSLPRIVGLRRAMEIALLSDNIDAAEALRLGMINRIAKRDALAAETEQLAQRLANGPSFAFGQMKRLLRNSSERSLQQQMDAERDAFCACAATADFREGIDAFITRRPAKFGGT